MARLLRRTPRPSIMMTPCRFMLLMIFMRRPLGLMLASLVNYRIAAGDCCFPGSVPAIYQIIGLQICAFPPEVVEGVDSLNLFDPGNQIPCLIDAIVWAKLP
jgi:hypothetical protein